MARYTRVLSEDLRNNEALIKRTAWRCWQRLAGMGAASMDYEDVIQELTLVFIRCHEKFDWDRGLQFSTYFTTASWNRMNGIAASVEEERIENGTFSVSDIAGEDGDWDFYETIASNDMQPDEVVERAQHADRVIAKLSPLAQQAVHWLLEPPEELIGEVKAEALHASLERAAGNRVMARREVSIDGICDLFMRCGATREEVREVRRELNAISKGSA